MLRRAPLSAVSATLGLNLAAVALIAYADHLTGYEIRLAIVYLVPIAWATWRLGGLAGALVSAAAVLCWFITFESTHPYGHPGYFYWEGAILSVTFLTIVSLLALLHRALERSDQRLLTVLEGLDAAVRVDDTGSGALLYDNRRYRERFGERRFGQEGGEIHDAGTNAWYLLQTRSLRWTDGRPALLRMLTDITEERRAREGMARQREAAHRTSRLVALGESASAIAHELNQPLAAIATYNNVCLRLLDAGETGSPELQEAMRKCRDQARRAGAIIQRLREVLRHPMPSPAHLDLGEVADTVRQLAEPEAAEAGVALERSQPRPLRKVRTDRLLIEQVGLNLVRNAIEAVQQLPPERRRVTIETGEEDGQVLFSVRDAGEGIPAQVNGRLFEAFVTSKPGGLGLGLSICRSVVESLGGRIAYRHDPAEGTRFSFTLPAADP